MRNRLPLMFITLILIAGILACGISAQTAPTQTPPNPPSGPSTAAAAVVPTIGMVPTAALTARPVVSTTPAPVPPEYQAMYKQIKAGLDAVKAAYAGQTGPAPLFAAELSYANGNVGPALLNPAVLDLVRLQLDQLSQIGVGGVVLAIKFPMLEPDFPRSAEYLQFFKQVAAEVHQRNMKLLVESGALFSGTIFSPLTVDWSRYPNAQAFRLAEIHQLQTIATEIRPDYLQIANEPTTTAMLTHFVDSPADYAAFVRLAFSAIPPQPGMLLGAGAGTWENQAFVTGLFDIPGLDFIDLHVYPVGANGGMLSLVASLAQQAHAAGKRAVISEAWLYKIGSGSAFQASDFTSAIGRDTFSFWEPLDEEFIQDLTAVSRAGGIEFVSFFWVREFYAYLDFAQYHAASPAQLNQAITTLSVANSRQQIYSPLGLFFQAWIIRSK